MEVDVPKLLKFAAAGFSERDSNSQVFEDIQDFCSPFSNDWYNSEADKTFEEPVLMYDSIGMRCMNDFVNTLSKNITPRDIPFVKLTVGPTVKDEEVKKQLNILLDYINDIMYAYLSASNFYVVAAEMFRELGAGTGVMWLHEGTAEKPFRFASTPISQIGLCTGNDGQVDKIFRKIKMDVSQLENTYPGCEVNIPQDLKANTKKGEKTELLEAQWHDYKTLTWNFALIHESTKTAIIKKEYKERMCFTPRWMTTTGKALGIGPFMQAMPDIRTVNRARDLTFQSAEMSIYNMFTVVSDGDFNPSNILLEPGAIIPVTNSDSLTPLQTSTDPSLQELLDRELKDDIKATTMNDKLPEQQPTPASAFEIAQRIKEFTSDFGVVYAIMLHEFIEPLVIRMLGILERLGLINLKDADIELPKDVRLDTLIDGLAVKVSITSPIGQIQALQDIEAVTQFYALLDQLSTNPSLLTKISTAWEQLPQFLQQKLSVDAKLLADKTPEEIKQEVEDALEKQAEMLAQQNQPEPQG